MSETKRTTRKSAPAPSTKTEIDPNVKLLSSSIILSGLIGKGITGEAALEAARHYVEKLS